MAELAFAQESPYLASEINETCAAAHDATAQLKEITQKMGEYASLCRQLSQVGADLSRKLAALGSSSQMNGALGSSSGSGHGGGFVPSSEATSNQASKQLSSMMSELSSSNELLGETLLFSFVNPLEIFVNSRELPEIDRMLESYSKSSSEYSAAVGQYLQTDFATHKATTAARLDYRALDVVKRFKKSETDRFDLIERIKSYGEKSNLEVIQACTCAAMSVHNFAAAQRSALAASTATVTSTNELSLRMDGLKQSFLNNQIQLGSHRRDLISCLDSMIERVAATPHRANSGRRGEHKVGPDRGGTH